MSPGIRARGLAAAVLFAAPAAHAHIAATPNDGTAGTYFQTFFTVGHGCAGKATTEIRLRLPDAVLSARPEAKPGWRIAIATAPLAEPVAGPHGTMTTERIVEIVWSHGALDDAHFDRFGLLLKLPDRAGDTLWFPVTQVCGDTEVAWDEVPAPGEAWSSRRHPAPFVTVTGRDTAAHRH